MACRHTSIGSDICSRPLESCALVLQVSFDSLDAGSRQGSGPVSNLKAIRYVDSFCSLYAFEKWKKKRVQASDHMVLARSAYLAALKPLRLGHPVVSRVTPGPLADARGHLVALGGGVVGAEGHRLRSALQRVDPAPEHRGQVEGAVATGGDKS